jgi:DNA-binding NarL/FixJ family response regulator
MAVDEGVPVRVLVVEDHPTLAYALRELLETDERLIVLDVVGTGRALLGHPLLDDVDVVLTDVHLPDVDGFMLVESLHETHPHVRVVVMSGSGDERTAGEALARGARAYVEKGSIDAEIAERIVGAAAARPT